MMKYAFSIISILSFFSLVYAQPVEITIDDYLAAVTEEESPDHFIATTMDLQLPFDRFVEEVGKSAVLRINRDDPALIGLLLSNRGNGRVEVNGDKERVLNAGERTYLPLREKGTEIRVTRSGETAWSDLVFGKVYVEKTSYSRARRFGFGATLPCHVDIHCPEGLPWAAEAKGVSRVFMVLEEGIGYCSGSLLNNTRQDRTPYILSAYHCFDGYTPVWEEWRIDFGMESYLCGEPSHNPEPMEFFGCDLVAGDPENDFALLRLDDNIPQNAPVAFLGWDRTPSYFPDTAVLIHHPQGDLKKVALNVDELGSNPNQIFWNNGVVAPANSHFRCYLDVGAYEGGSSGAPFMDAKGHVIGQLHGGNQGCNENLAYSGMINRSWEGDEPSERLRDWLDPLNTGSFQLDMLNESPDGQWISAGGFLTNALGMPIANATVGLAGSVIRGQTAADGSFSFSFFFPGEEQPVVFVKQDDPRNGVNILDLISVTKHILDIEPYGSQALVKAADVTGDGLINVLDIIHLQKVILEIENQFPVDPVWFPDPQPEMLNESNYQDLHIKGYKLGDLNHSADPTL